jgi:hypothetical protein
LTDRVKRHFAVPILLHLAAISLGCGAAAGQAGRAPVTSGPPASVEFRDVVTQRLAPEFQGRLHQCFSHVVFLNEQRSLTH